jgi:hypothetical protein
MHETKQVASPIYPKHMHEKRMCDLVESVLDLAHKELSIGITSKHLMT